jgi:hypothetical protein
MEYMVIKLTGTAGDNLKIKNSITKALEAVPCAEVLDSAAKTIFAKIRVDDIIASCGDADRLDRNIRENIAREMAYHLVEQGFVSITKKPGRYKGVAYKYTEHVGLLTIIREESNG